MKPQDQAESGLRLAVLITLPPVLLFWAACWWLGVTLCS